MKRSEMVLIMSKVLENNFDADRLLDVMEKLGMNPPYRKKTEEEKKLLDCINNYRFCHRWEQE